MGIGFNTEVDVGYRFGIYAQIGPGRSQTMHNGCQSFLYVIFVYVLGCNFRFVIGVCFCFPSSFRITQREVWIEFVKSRMM